MKKPTKKDIYNLGRHKVKECEKSENGQEMKLVVTPIDENCRTTKICMLRDF